MKSRTAALTVAAMGVVFGDIGTSPLYALRACFSDVAGVSVNAPSVLGILSLIFWSLLLVISVKYVGIILRADNDGEGGVLALTTRVLNEMPMRGTAVIATLGLIGCALFYGDGVITPAVTVLGAIEGLSIAAPSLGHAVLPLAILALIWLFWLQRRGTGAIGRLFGPIMGEGPGRKLCPEHPRGRTGMRLQLIEKRGVVGGIDDHGHVRVILGRSAQHRRSADVDVLDRFLVAAVRARDGLCEGVEIDDEEVDRGDAMSRMVSLRGPTKMKPLFSTRSAKSAFSERNPYPG